MSDTKNTDPRYWESLLEKEGLGVGMELNGSTIRPQEFRATQPRARTRKYYELVNRMIDQMPDLSEKSRRVLQLHAQGLSLREIGAICNLSHQGVKSLIRREIERFGARSRTKPEEVI